MTTSTADREIVLTRLLDAPRELVFRTWTEPEHVARWWGPRGFTTTTHAIDVRPGGAWRFIMHGPDGTDFNNKIVFREVVKPERLVYAQGSDDTDEAHWFNVTVTFAEERGRTRLTMRMVFPTAAAREQVVREFGAIEGGLQHLDRLVEYLPGMEPVFGELHLQRVFQAPRERVYQAWTEPERLAKWWGPKGMDSRVVRFELRPGGVFHYRMTAPDGSRMWGKFVYREVHAPERIVFLNSFADEAGNTIRAPFSADFPLEFQNTVTLSEQEGRTTLTLRGVPVNATEAERRMFDSMRQSMQQGFGGTFEQLARYLADAGTAPGFVKGQVA
jgi:uncharacterized protein YndB with AHSA1/START domain